MSERKRVVVIDDAKSILSAMVVLLSSLGVKVEPFSDPNEALAMIKIIKPDLIITDYIMFDMDGLELIDELQKEGCTVPIVLLTGMPEKDTSEECCIRGVDFMKKPLQINDLKILLKRYSII